MWQNPVFSQDCFDKMPRQSLTRRPQLSNPTEFSENQKAKLDEIQKYPNLSGTAKEIQTKQEYSYVAKTIYVSIHTITALCENRKHRNLWS